MLRQAQHDAGFYVDKLGEDEDFFYQRNYILGTSLQPSTSGRRVGDEGEAARLVIPGKGIKTLLSVSEV